MSRRVSLSTEASTLLGQASGAGIQDAAPELRKRLEDGSMLGSERNLYWPHPDQRFRKSKRNWRHQLALYMAAAIPEHCIDGWAYLGRAMQAHMRGDPDGARHLAYYAELRAGIALLSSQGIGVFNGVNVVMDKDGHVLRLPARPGVISGGGNIRLGTHQAVWLFLESWSPQSGLLLETVLTPRGTPLSEWLAAAGLQSQWSAVAPSLMQRWGLDLRRLSSDREARNAASYLPTRIRRKPALTPTELGDYVYEVWATLRPTASSPFEALDLGLLKVIIHEAVASSAPVSQKAEATRRAVRAAVSGAVAPTESSAAQVGSELEKRLLRADSEEEPKIIAYAALSPNSEDREHHLAVIARAVLLLRVATGATRQLLRDAGVTRADLVPWMLSLGIERGLWLPHDEPEEITDRWSDIEAALEDLQEDLASPVSSVFEFANGSATSLSRLSGCELVPLWSIAA